VIVVSPTGSGKTLAYVLPLLHLLADLPDSELRAIALVPTRELASQVFRQFRRFSGANTTRVELLRKNRRVPNCQILVGTPKRFLVAAPPLGAVKFVVIDEADHLLSHSFVQQTDEVLGRLPRDRFQVSLLSATFNQHVEDTARSFMVNAIRIQVGDEHAVAALIRQELKFVGKEKGKVLEIRQRLSTGELALPAIIFVMNRQRAIDLAHELALPCAVLTSEESDSERGDAIRRLRTGEVHFLITTDLGGRGIDLAALQTVINFDLPPDSTTYIHRIGRTARAGRAGNAITFFTTDDQRNLRPVASVMKKYGYEVEDWMLRSPDRRHRGARTLFEPAKRHTISSRIWKNAKARNPKPKLPPNVD
jgi:ATP-dependent RNA helicase DDX52/ROK1